MSVFAPAQIKYLDNTTGVSADTRRQVDTQFNVITKLLGGDITLRLLQSTVILDGQPLLSLLDELVAF